MLRHSTILCALVLVIGCSSDEREPSETPAPEEEPLSLVGNYRVDTAFVTTVEELGAGSSAIDTLIELRDPSAYLADQIANEVNLPKEVVILLVEDAVGDRDQDIEESINDLLAETVEWDMESRLEIDGGSEENRNLELTHYAELVRTTIEGEEREFELDTHGTGKLATAKVRWTEPRVTLEEHVVSLKDLAMLEAVIEAKLAPAIAEGTTNIEDALLAVADCDGMSGQIGTAACLAGVSAAAENIEEKLGELKTYDVDITMVGRADARDVNRDNRVDTLEGTWFSQFHTDGVTVDAPLEASRIGF